MPDDFWRRVFLDNCTFPIFGYGQAIFGGDPSRFFNIVDIFEYIFYFICIIYNIILIFELTNNFINN